MLPLVSIVMPSYNAEDTIRAAIESVLAQSWKHWELLVVDDCSSDGTRDEVLRARAADPRVRLLSSPVNSGSPATPRNLGISQAKGQYVAFLDADDVWLPEKLLIQLEVMRSEGATLSCTGYQVMGSSSRRFLPRNRSRLKAMLWMNQICCSTAMYDASKLRHLRFPHIGHEDYALWLDTVSLGIEIIGVPRILAEYRISPGSVSASPRRNIGYLYTIYSTILGHSRTRSGFLSIRYAVVSRLRFQLWRLNPSFLRVT